MAYRCDEKLQYDKVLYVQSHNMSHTVLLLVIWFELLNMTKEIIN